MAPPSQLAVIAAWGAGAVLYATHLYLYHRLQEQPASFGLELREALVHFGAWALLTPLVLSLAATFDLLDRRWPRRLALHLPLALALALIQLSLHTVLDHAAIHHWAGGAARLAPLFRSYFVRTYFANVVVYFLIVLGAGGFAHAQRRRIREAELERHLAQAQLDALRLQLQPHFLFNALNAVAALIGEDPAAAQRMVARLADLLRLALDQRNAGEVPLSREIEMARTYLAIEQVRFQDRLRIEVRIHPEAEEALVPGLLLQPLLENAIRHGIAAKVGPGLLEVTAEVRGDRLMLLVRDDGEGLGSQVPSREGIGLANVRSRLVRLYGGDQRLELRPATGGGAEALIDLPLRRAASTEHPP